MVPSYAARRQKLIAEMGVQSHQAVLATNPTDIHWLSGFTGSAGQVFIGSSDAFLITDGRYTERAAVEAPDIETFVPTKRGLAALFERLKGSQTRELLVDATHVTVALLRTLETAAQAEGLEVSALAFPTPALRMAKDDYEVTALRRACALSDAALAATIEQVRIGMTEKQLAFLLETTMVEMGADARAFESIVAAGEHSAIPHHSPTDRPLQRGDLLKIDFGALAAGYHADETRTFVLGEPEQWQIDIHAVVARSQQAGRDALRAGVSLQEVDAASRTVIADAGYAEFFMHGLGHGVGLQIHEEPFFSPSSTAILSAGNAVTIEPGIYLPGRGGVRIEDTLLVGQHDAESLTTTPRELRVLC